MSFEFLLSCDLPEFCCGGMKIYARFSQLVCMLNGIVICCGPDSKLMSSCMMMICSVGRHGGNDLHWSEDVMKYSYDGIYCFYHVTWNVPCRNHGDCGCGIYKDGTMTLICYICTCPSVSGEWLICCGAWYGSLVCYGVQVCLRMVSNVDSPLLYVHIHHT